MPTFPMPLQAYHLLHIVGLILVYIGFGALLSSEGAKAAMKWHGAGLLLSLVSGFGLLAKLGMERRTEAAVFVSKLPQPHQRDGA